MLLNKFEPRKLSKGQTRCSGNFCRIDILKIFGDVYQLLLLMIASGHIVSISEFMSLGGLKKSQIRITRVLEGSKSKEV